MEENKVVCPICKKADCNNVEWYIKSQKEGLNFEAFKTPCGPKPAVDAGSIFARLNTK